MTVRLTVLLILLCFVACGKNGEPSQHDESLPLIETGSLTWSAPDGWIEEELGSEMRLAQYRLPKVEGDDADAKAYVFHFPGSGGSVEANLNRWYGQFIQPDGKSSASVAKINKADHNGLRQTTVDLSGTFRQSTTPMGPTSAERPNYRMLAGVIETSAGPWFVKLLGPERTVSHWESSFYEFMKSFRPES